MAIRTDGIALKVTEQTISLGTCIVDMKISNQSYLLTADTNITATNMSSSEHYNVTLILKTGATPVNITFNSDWNWSNVNSIPSKMGANETLVFELQSVGDANTDIFINSDSIQDSELNVVDSRGSSTLPQDYSKGLNVELKNDTDLSISEDGLAGLMTIKPWTNDVNVYATQLLLNSQGLKFRNGRIDQSNDWGAWSTIADRSWVTTEINNLIAAAPDALNTLNELSAALGDDPNFAVTMTNELGNKVDKITGKGLSTNDLTDTLLGKLWTSDNLVNLSDLNNDLPILTGVSGDGNSNVTFTLNGGSTIVQDFSHTHSYLPLSGGTLTNTLYINNDGHHIKFDGRWGTILFDYDDTETPANSYMYGLYTSNDEGGRIGIYDYTGLTNFAWKYRKDNQNHEFRGNMIDASNMGHGTSANWKDAYDKIGKVPYINDGNFYSIGFGTSGQFTGGQGDYYFGVYDNSNTWKKGKVGYADIAGDSNSLGGTAAASYATQQWVLDQNYGTGSGTSIWDENGSDVYKLGSNIGIGISTPNDKLNIHGAASSNLGIKITRDAETNGLRLGVNDSHAFLWGHENQDLALATNNVQMLTLKSTGNIQINYGTTKIIETNLDGFDLIGRIKPNTRLGTSWKNFGTTIETHGVIDMEVADNANASWLWTIKHTGTNTFLGGMQILNTGGSTRWYNGNNFLDLTPSGTFLYNNASIKFETTGSGTKTTGTHLVTSDIHLVDSDTKLAKGAGDTLLITTPSGTVTIGAENSSHTHLRTDRSSFYFADPIQVKTSLTIYGTSTSLVDNKLSFDANNYISKHSAYDTLNLANGGNEMMISSSAANLYVNYRAPESGVAPTRWHWRVGTENPAEYADHYIKDLIATGTLTASGGDSTEWNTAYSWGDHAGLYLGINSTAVNADKLDNVDSSGFALAGSLGAPDYDTVKRQGLYRIDPATNGPTSAHYALSVYGNNSNVTAQLASHYQTGETYIRAFNSVWSSWRKVWDSVNSNTTSIPWNASTLTTASTISSNDRRLVMRDNSLEEWKTNGLAQVVVNYYGYNGGNTQFRDFKVYNGKGGQIAHFEGSSGNVAFGTTINSSYRVKIAGNLSMSNSVIHHISDLHFNDGVRFIQDGNNKYLNFKWDSSTNGGIKFVNGAGQNHGFIYGTSSGSDFGLLDSGGTWALRIENDVSTELRVNNVTRIFADTSGVIITGHHRISGMQTITGKGSVSGGAGDTDVALNIQNVANESSSIVFSSGSNKTSDRGFIRFIDHCGVDEVPGSGENNMLVIGVENDAATDRVRIRGGWVEIAAKTTSGTPTKIASFLNDTTQKSYIDLNGVYQGPVKQLATARTITLTGDVTGSVSFDGTSNVTMTTVVGNGTHSHDDRYYTESESDSRYVNTAGDIMTGSLTTRDKVEVKNTSGSEGFKMQWNDSEKSIDFIFN